MNIEEVFKNSKKVMNTNKVYWYMVGMDFENNLLYALVFHYDEEEQSIYGKVAYQPINSIMQCDYDFDWTMPCNEMGEVYDTNIPINNKEDIEWLYTEWKRIKEMFYD